MNDPDKHATYDAEHMLASWLDAVSPQTRTVNCLGATFQPEDEVKFTDPDAVQTYVDRVLDHLRRNGHSYDGQEHTAVTVKARRGAKAAEYANAVITIPPREIGGAWSLRETVVLHEIAHHLDTSGGPAHGARFRATLVRLLENIGSPVTAHLLQGAYAERGLAGDLPTSSDGKSLDKIAKLLRQAEGATTDHERDAFMDRAQSLATQHSIALAIARTHTARREAREEPTFRDIRIGAPGKRGLAKYIELFLGIAAANDVKCTIVSDNTLVTAHGFPSDIEVCEALFASLAVQMVAAGESYLSSGQHKSEIVTTFSEARLEWVEKPMPTITARLAFYTAFARRVAHRLAEARKGEVAAAVAVEEDGNLPVSTTLALREKTAAVYDFFEQQKIAQGVRGSWKGYRNTSRYRAHGAEWAGDLAAREASLSGDTTPRIGTGA